MSTGGGVAAGERVGVRAVERRGEGADGAVERGASEAGGEAAGSAAVAAGRVGSGSGAVGCGVGLVV
jgi:hypothetical protein